MKCEICKEEFDKEESIRKYGSNPSENGCCSPQCYTKKLLKKEEQKKVKKMPSNKEKKIYAKEYTVKAGQEDWRVWNRANDYLFQLMQKKRKRKYSERILKKDIRVKIILVEEKAKKK